MRALLVRNAAAAPQLQRRASDGFATENLHVLGKVVGGGEPLARRLATVGVTRGHVGRGVLMAGRSLLQISGQRPKPTFVCPDACNPFGPAVANFDINYPLVRERIVTADGRVIFRTHRVCD
jgi:hypothetical protein